MNKEKLESDSQLELERLIAKNELKTKWLSLIAHDFKGMFHNITFMLDALESKLISEEQFQSMLPELKQISEKNLKTLENTFAWVNLQADGFNPQEEEVSIYKLFLQLQKELDSKVESKNLALIFSGDENIVMRSDKLLLTFILKQTLENAIKYSNKFDEVMFITSLQHNTIHIEIKDFGIGMNTNVLNNIFTLNNSPYKGTADEVGAGLSLVIVRDFVEKLGGTIEVASKLNEGTTVKLMFGTKL